MKTDQKEQFIEAAFDDVNGAILFLVERLNFDEDEVNEMGCSEINDLIETEIKNLDLDGFVAAIEGFDLEGFNNESSVNLSKDFISNGNLKQPCKNPCPSCPYTKSAVSGYFGGEDGNVYSDAIHQDTIIACHSRTKHNEETGLPKSYNDVSICTGHIVSQIKSCKNSMHPDGVKAHILVRSLSNFQELKDNALAFDFKVFHKLK
jgi:hypothetical protein